MYKFILKNTNKSPHSYKIISTLFCLILVVNSAVAQPLRVSLPESRMTVLELLRSVEQQTDYRFSWDRTFDVDRELEVTTEPQMVDELMRVVLKDTDKTYVMADGFVLIKDSADSNESNYSKERQLALSAVDRRVERVEFASEGELVEGVVRVAKSNQPVTNVVVTFYGAERVYTTTTDERGNFSKSELPLGSYSVSFSHLDYGETSCEVEVGGGKRERLVVMLPQLERGGAATGVVSNPREPLVTNNELIGKLNSHTKQNLPVVALKTNLLYGAFTTLNLGVEVRISKRMTLDIPVSYNPWTFSENKRITHLMVQPEFRLWVHEPFNGHYFGLHAHYAHFNTANIRLPFGLWKEWRDSRYQGDLYGGGFAYGYQWILGNRFNLEATLGIGYFYAKYNRYECPKCGETLDRGLSKHYFGPTKLGITLSFMIK